MKDKLKYLAAVLFAATIGFGFIPMINLVGIELSMMDILKNGLGFYGDSEAAQVIFGAIQSDLEPFAWCIAVSLVIVLIEAFLTAVLGGRKAYVISLISCILDALALAATVLVIQIAMDEVKRSVAILGLSGTLSISLLPVILTAAAYFLIFILSVLGISMGGSKKQKKSRKNKNDEMYLEQIRMLDDQQPVPEPQPEPWQQAAPEPQPQSWQQPTPEPQPEPWQQPAPEPQPQSWQQPTPEPEPQSWQQPIPEPEPAAVHVQPEKKSSEPFTGAVIGGAGGYKGKVYPLKKMTEVFFEMEAGQMVLTPYQSEASLAGVYYIEEYGEYCVEPMERGCFYLESGQPLGKGRKYYLPRGTKVYLKDKENKYTLA